MPTAFCRHIQCDIQLAAEKIQAPDQLKAAVVKLLQTHAPPDGGAGKKAGGAAAEEIEGLQRWVGGWVGGWVPARLLMQTLCIFCWCC